MALHRVLVPKRRRAASTIAGFSTCVLLCACGGPLQHKPIEMEPIGTVKNIPTTPIEDDSDGGVTTPNSGTPNPAREAACTAVEFDNLEEALRGCDVPMPRAADVPSVKDKIDVKVAMSTPATTPGGRVDVTITLRNKSDSALALYFTGDPNPHFDVEALDSKGRRADYPTGKWPGYPKGFKPETREAKAFRVTLDKGGSARLKVTWDAVKTKWAPDKASSWEGRGFPRAPAGPLSKGKYTLRLVVPIIGDLDIPKSTIDVGS